MWVIVQRIGDRNVRFPIWVFEELMCGTVDMVSKRCFDLGRDRVTGVSVKGGMLGDFVSNQRMESKQRAFRNEATRSKIFINRRSMDR